MIYWLRFLYRRDISVQSLHCTLVHLEFYCSVIRRNEINEIGRNRVIFSVVFHRRNLFWLLISYFDHWRKLSCIAITKVTCHFTANRCCETFPDCCETFPVCCETFPDRCETFPVCCEFFSDCCEKFQTFSVYENGQDKVKGWVRVIS